MSSRIQNLLMILGIVLIAALGYYLYIQRSSMSLEEGVVRDQIAFESASILSNLNEIKSITFDASIFANPRFTSLVDFSGPVNPQAVGNSNPFAGN